MVTGAGPIGGMHVRLARARGAGKVFLIDISAERLRATAERVEPEETIDASSVDAVEQVHKLTDGRGADVIIVAAGSGQAQIESLEMAAPRGSISFFGGLPKDNPTIELNANTVHYKELTITGTSGSTPRQNKKALELIASGDVPVADLVTDRLPLEEVVEGIQKVIDGEGIKIVIEP